jgi:hypothetical protein
VPVVAEEPSRRPSRAPVDEPGRGRVPAAARTRVRRPRRRSRSTPRPGAPAAESASPKSQNRTVLTRSLPRFLIQAALLIVVAAAAAAIHRGPLTIVLAVAACVRDRCGHGVAGDEGAEAKAGQAAARSASCAFRTRRGRTARAACPRRSLHRPPRLRLSRPPVERHRAREPGAGDRRQGRGA